MMISEQTVEMHLSTHILRYYNQGIQTKNPPEF